MWKLLINMDKKVMSPINLFCNETRKLNSMQWRLEVSSVSKLATNCGPWLYFLQSKLAKKVLNQLWTKRIKFDWTRVTIVNMNNCLEVSWSMLLYYCMWYTWDHFKTPTLPEIILSLLNYRRGSCLTCKTGFLFQQHSSPAPKKKIPGHQREDGDILSDQ